MKLNSQDYIDLSNGNYTVHNKETGSTTSNLKAYGISTISYSTSANNKYTIDAPITSVEKVIVIDSTSVTDSTSVQTYVYTGSTAITIAGNSTLYKENLYINFQPPYGLIKLIGLSTSKWGVVGTYGGVQLSTAATYTT